VKREVRNTILQWLRTSIESFYQGFLFKITFKCGTHRRKNFNLSKVYFLDCWTFDKLLAIRIKDLLNSRNKISLCWLHYSRAHFTLWRQWPPRISNNLLMTTSCLRNQLILLWQTQVSWELLVN